MEDKNMSEIQEMNKSNLQNLFNRFLNLLRDNEYLTGKKALKNISNLITFRLIESKLDKEINIYDHDFEFEDADVEISEEMAEKLIKYTKFSVIASEKEENIPRAMKYVWDYVLAVHPKTKDIFIKGKGFDIQHQETYKTLFIELNKFNFEDIDNDILGDIYENVIKYTMTGKIFGQYFTPPQVKQMIVKLVNPKLKSDGTIETICDPTMGTGGFLITSLKHIREQSKLTGTKINWDYISKGALSGKDCELDTYHLGKTNMFISTGYMLDGLHFGDSIRQPIKEEFDIVLANPPFGIKGLKYANIPLHDRPQYAPISTNNAVSLFLQVIIGILKVNGRCGIVLPYGQDIFGKTKGLKQIREYLMKTCDLKEVIQLPSGVFEYTSIKTCVFYFHKKKDVLDVVEKRNESSCTLVKEHSTTSVKFYEFTDLDVKDKKFILEVSIDDIIKNDYSLNVAEYVVEEKKEFSKDIVMMKLGDICEINNGKRVVKNKVTPGEYPVYGGGGKTFTSNEYNREGFTILISRFGMSEKCVRLMNIKYFLNDSGLTLQCFDKFNKKYIGYYLYNNIDKVYQCGRGTAQKNLEISKFLKIQIPVPSIELQKHIVDQSDFINESIATDNKKIEQLKKLNEIYLKMYIETKNYEEKKLGDICEFKNGKQLSKSKFIEGEYPVIGGGKILGFHNTFNSEKNEIVLTRVGNFTIKFMNCNYYLTDNAFALKSKSVNKKYLYYYIKNNKKIFINLYKGTAQKVITKTNLSNIKIPVPPFEIQKRIVDYCEKNDDQIKMLEENIKSQEQLCKEFMSNYLGQDDSAESSDPVGLTDIVEPICLTTKTDDDIILKGENTSVTKVEKPKKKISKSKIIKKVSKSKIVKKV